MNNFITYAEGVELAGLDPDKARKASLVLRASGHPVTVQGYFTSHGIENLVQWCDTAAGAYDAAEKALRIEEQERDADPEDQFHLPQDSHLTPAVVARMAAETLADARHAAA